MEAKPTRSQFKSLMQQKGIHLPFDEFKKGDFIKFNGSEFYVDKEKKDELNSTFLFDSNENQSLDLSIKKELISIELNNLQKTQDNTIDLIELDSVSSQLFESEQTSEVCFPLPAPLPTQLPAQLPIPFQAPLPAPIVKQRCLGLDKTVDQDQIYWHVEKITGQRNRNNKRQYKVNWSEYNGKKFRPSWTNESLLNCSELIVEFNPKANPRKFTPAEDDLEITRSEVIHKNKKYKTNQRHIEKRN
jgi:hypothetical protein